MCIKINLNIPLNNHKIRIDVMKIIDKSDNYIYF